MLSGDLRRRLAAEGHGCGTYYTTEHAAELAANPDLFMPSLVDLVTTKALPFLTEYGTDLRSYVRLHETFAASRPGGVGTVHTQTEAAEAHLLLGNVEAARRSYRNVLLVAAEQAANMPDWMAERVRAAEAQLDRDDADLLAFAATLRPCVRRKSGCGNAGTCHRRNAQILTPAEQGNASGEQRCNHHHHRHGQDRREKDGVASQNRRPVVPRRVDEDVLRRGKRSCHDDREQRDTVQPENLASQDVRRSGLHEQLEQRHQGDLAHRATGHRSWAEAQRDAEREQRSRHCHAADKVQWVADSSRQRPPSHCQQQAQK
jgi:hypothetical protein